MKSSLVAFILIFCFLAVAGCSGGSAPSPTTVLPTESPPTAAPTMAPSPEPIDPPPATEAPTEIPAEAPDGPFREEFDNGFDAAWLWINEDADRWEITNDGWLQITADDPPFAPETTEIPMVNVFTRPVPAGVDIAVTTHVIADPDENFEQAALFLIEDGNSYALVNIGFCGFCTGKSIYLEAYADGQSLLEGVQSFQLPEDQIEVWLRLEYSPSGNALVALVALEDGDWQRVGPVIRDPPMIGTLAIGAANVPGPEADPEEDLVAQFDYVELEVYE